MTNVAQSETALAPYREAIVLALLLLSGVGGCQQRAANKLLGRWEGSPDSAAARAEREAEKYGDVDKNSDPTDLVAGSSAKTDQAVQVTDWEAYDETIVMDFVSSDRIEMSLAGKQLRSGTWKVISTSPAGCTIEVQTETESEVTERRRFDLLLDERDGTCVGFQLTEIGADPQVGALYFRRPES